MTEYDPPALSARLVFVALHVPDLAAAAAFYRDAIGIPLRESGDAGSSEPRHYEYSWREGAYLHFALFTATGAETRHAHVAFFVDDVELAHSRAVAAGATVVHAPRDEPWGRTAAYVDPAGNAVAVTQRATARD